MSGSSKSEQLLALFRSAAEAQPVPAGPHFADDDELLTCWSLRQLSSQEATALVEHLGVCPYCRRGLAELIRAGVVEPPDIADGPAATAKAVKTVPQVVWVWRRQALVGVGLATAAAILVAALWLWPLSGPEATLAKAQQELNTGNSATALDRLERLLSADLDSDVRERAKALAEQAAYMQARSELESGEFQWVLAVALRAGRQGVRSARLSNLRLQAERGFPFEVALARAGSLVDYGYLLDGSSPERTLPVIDDAKERLEREFKEAVAEHPQDAALRMNYGQFLLTLARYEQAKEQFAAALKTSEDRVLSQLGLGVVAYELQEPRAALAHFEAALQAAPNNAAAQLNAAICLERLGERTKAKGHWEQVQQLTDDPQLKRRIQAYLKKTDE